jgi:hypothetical protein
MRISRNTGRRKRRRTSTGYRRSAAGVVSYLIREPEDMPGVVELFRMSYDRAKESAERRMERIQRTYSNEEQGERSA